MCTLRMVVEFLNAPTEFLSLLIGERKGLALTLGGDVVPEFLDEFELLGRGELEEFFAKGIRCHDESLPLVSECGKSSLVVPPLGRFPGAAIG